MNTTKIVLCLEKEDALKLLSYLEQKGYQELPIIETWNLYKQDTCYRIKDKTVVFGNLDFYKNTNNEIINVEEFLGGIENE